MGIDKKIFNENFRYYYRPLCMYALHYVKDIDSSEDIVQDCFTEVWERKVSLEDVDNMRAYLYTMVRNRCSHFLKEKSKQQVTNDEQLYEVEDETNEEEYEERSFLEAKMLTVIENLPERCREALLLSRRDGLKHEEIAKNMSVSVNTVKNHINKALKIIRQSGNKVYVFFFS